VDDLQELLERAEWLREQVADLRVSLGRIESHLQSFEELLDQTIAHNLLGDDRGTPDIAGNLSSALPHEELADALRFDEADDVEQRERRTLPRRRGHPVAVDIASSQEGASSPLPGWAIDRSPDGLCIVTEHFLPVGTLARVRPAASAVDAAWFDVEVRNCRAERNRWVLGCQFLQALSWVDLRLFS
jgi:hypothetical protein